VEDNGAVPDFTQPGRDGSLPDGVPEWRDGLGTLTRRGLIYTSRGARDVISCDQPYRIMTSIKRKLAKGDATADFGGLYRRATEVAAARASEIRCAHGESVRVRIAGHSWARIPGGSHEFPMAALVAELHCPKAARDPGPPAPVPADLSAPGGTSREEFARLASTPSEEFYNEYDVRDELESNAEPVSFSYGEHVESCADIDFAPFVERAEERARSHYCLLAGGSSARPFSIQQREWFVVPESLVVVVVYFQA
jgi:hypothetical protein